LAGRNCAVAHNNTGANEAYVGFSNSGFSNPFAPKAEDESDEGGGGGASPRRLWLGM